MGSAEDFRDVVKAYIDAHDEITAASKQLSLLRKKKAEMEEAVLAYMRANAIDECALSDGKLVRTQTKRTETLNKTHILAEVTVLVGNDPDRARNVVDAMYSNRQVKVADALKRTRLSS